MIRARRRAIVCMVMGILGVVVSGCGSTEARDPMAGVTATSPGAGGGLLLTMSDLPDLGWVKTPATADTPASSADVSLSPAACARSTAALASANQAWDDPARDQSVTYILADASGGETKLKEEVVRAANGVSTDEFLAKVRELVSDCTTFTAETAGGTITGSTVWVDLGQGPSDYALTQSWSNAAGAAVTKTYIYLVQGDTVAAITLTTNSSTVDVSDLASIVKTASSRLRNAP